MKFKDLFEKVVDNNSLLNDLYDIVVDIMPQTFKPHEVIHKNKYNIITSNKYKKIYNKYKNTKYENVLNIFKNIIITFDNSDILSTTGSYIYKDKSTQEQIIIYIGSLNKKIDYVSKNSLLYNKLIDGDSFKSIIIHELRHFVQFNMFDKKYLHNQRNYKDKFNNKFTYDNMNLEIDARFYDILNNHNPNKKDIRNFSKDVINDLQHYKKLTNKQLTHYLKKVIQYYIDINNSEEFKNKK